MPVEKIHNMKASVISQSLVKFISHRQTRDKLMHNMIIEQFLIVFNTSLHIRLIETRPYFKYPSEYIFIYWQHLLANCRNFMLNRKKEKFIGSVIMLYKSTMLTYANYVTTLYFWLIW